MHIKNQIVILILLLVSTVLFSQPTKLKPANTIRAIWNLSSQPCNGGGGNSMERHLNEKIIFKDKTVSISESGFNYSIPQLPDVKETIVKLFLNK